MGGRKGYTLKKIIGDTRKIRKEKKELLEWIEEKNPKKVVKSTGAIIAKSEKIVDSIVTSLDFVDSIETFKKDLKEEKTKERRKELSKKWAYFRKNQGKRFDPITNRKIVDSVNRALEGKK